MIKQVLCIMKNLMNRLTENGKFTRTTKINMSMNIERLSENLPDERCGIQGGKRKKEKKN